MARWSSYGSMWKPYVSVAERRQNAQKEVQKLAKKGQVVAPVVVAGRAIATTFWGKAWCEQLEKHCDYANRLPRGRTYVRNGSVVDLQIQPGQVRALVSGSELYKVAVQVAPLPAERWAALASDCVGQIDSLVELLQGKLAKGVLARLCHPSQGLLPQARELTFSCSCPDYASLCKHVAAVLYGVGSRLDQAPELLFVLRQVDQTELLSQVAVPALAGAAAETDWGDADLGDVFGLDMEAGVAPLPVAVAEPTVVPAMRRIVLPPKPVAKSKASRAKPAKGKVLRVQGEPVVPPATPAQQVADTPRKVPAAKPEPPAAAFVLGVLRQYPEQECSVADLHAWQERPDQHSRQALAAALLHLRAKGLVASSKDMDGKVYWRGV